MNEKNRAEACGATLLPWQPASVLVAGAVSLMFFASLPWLPILGALVTFGIAANAKTACQSELAKASVIIGVVLAAVAIVLCWMTPGFFTTVWG